MKKAVSAISIAGPLSIRAVAALLALTMNVVLAGMLQPAELGRFYSILVFAAIGAVLMRLGLDNVLIRSASVASLGPPDVRATTVRDYLSQVAGTIALIVVIGAILAVPLAASDVYPVSVLFLALLIAAMIAWAHVTSAVLQGMHRVNAASSTLFLVPPATFLCIVFAIDDLSLMQALIAHSAGYILAATISTLLVRAHGDLIRPRVFLPRKETIEKGMPFLQITILNMGPQWISVLVLGAFVGSESVGVVVFALKVTSVVAIIVSGINAFIAPRLATEFASHSLGAVSFWASRGAAAMTWLSLVPIGILVLIPNLFLKSAGVDMVNAAPVIAILALGQAANSIAGAAGCVLAMGSQESLQRWIVVGAAASILSLQLVLVPMFGAVGAAIAIATGQIAQNTVYWILCRRLWGIAILPVWRTSESRNVG